MRASRNRVSVGGGRAETLKPATAAEELTGHCTYCSGSKKMNKYSHAVLTRQQGYTVPVVPNNVFFFEITIHKTHPQRQVSTTLSMNTLNLT